MIKELTSLRVVLMLMIFAHHINTSYNGGYPAVASFFMLSGFVMTLAYFNKVQSSDFSYTTYLAKRIIRIYPLHWICLAAILLMGLIQHESAISSIRIFLLNALLLQSWFPDMDVYFSFNSLSWYCSALLFFLCLFPLILRFLAGISMKNLMILSAMLVGLYSVFWLLCPTIWRHSVLYVNPSMRLFDAMLGLCIGLWLIKIRDDKERQLFLSDKSTWLQIIAVLGVVLLAGFSILLPGRLKSFSLMYWIPTAMILFSLTTLSYTNPSNPLSKLLNSRPIQWLGRCSFSFYMIHALVIRYCAEYLRISFGFGWCDRALILFVIILLLAQLSYWLIEVKLTKQLNCLVQKIVSHE